MGDKGGVQGTKAGGRRMWQVEAGLHLSYSQKQTCLYKHLVKAALKLQATACKLVQTKDSSVQFIYDCISRLIWGPVHNQSLHSMWLKYVHCLHNCASLGMAYQENTLYI